MSARFFMTDGEMSLAGFGEDIISADLDMTDIDARARSAAVS